VAHGAHWATLLLAGFALTLWFVFLSRLPARVRRRAGPVALAVLVFAVLFQRAASPETWCPYSSRAGRVGDGTVGDAVRPRPRRSIGGGRRHARLRALAPATVAAIDPHAPAAAPRIRRLAAVPGSAARRATVTGVRLFRDRFLAAAASSLAAARRRRLVGLRASGSVASPRSSVGARSA
jgi:energy-coupling factor transporter transmembrane protein EcfT